MAGPGDVDDVGVAVTDDAVQMGVDQVQARRGAPVTEQPRLDVFGGQRLAQQRVVQQVDLADRQVIGGAPVGVDQGEFVIGQRGSRRGKCVCAHLNHNGRGRLTTCEDSVPDWHPNNRALRTTLTVVLGFAVPQFGESAHGDLAHFASTAEQLGADSLWVGDRLLAPVHPTVGYGGTDDIPVQFRTCLDPFVSLAVAATVTTTARLGSSVVVAPWYPPVQLARQLTSIDVISGGRLLPGFGIGWSPEEYQAAGAPFSRRGAQLDELLDTLEALWTTNPVKHQGDRWSIPESWVDLKPVQRPRPPIYLGAFTPVGLKRIGERADGWLAAVQVPRRCPPRRAEPATKGHRRRGPRRRRETRRTSLPTSGSMSRQGPG